MRHSICGVDFEDFLRIEAHISSIIDFFTASKRLIDLDFVSTFFVARFPKKTEGINYYVKFGYMGHNQAFNPIWEHDVQLQKIQGCNLNILAGVVINRLNSLFALTKEPLGAHFNESELYAEIIIRRK